MKVRLGDLPKEAHRIAFRVNPKEKDIDREQEISVQAGRIVGEIYDALLGQYTGTTGILPVGNGGTGTTGILPVGNGGTGTTGVPPVAVDGTGTTGVPPVEANGQCAVLAAYGLAPDTPEPEIVAHLLRLPITARRQQ